MRWAFSHSRSAVPLRLRLTSLVKQTFWRRGRFHLVLVVVVVVIGGSWRLIHSVYQVVVVSTIGVVDIMFKLSRPVSQSLFLHSSFFGAEKLENVPVGTVPLLLEDCVAYFYAPVTSL